MSQKYYLMIMGEIAEIKALLQSLHDKQPDEVLLDSHDMKKLLNIGDSTLLKLRKEGTIPCNKIGRKYYYPKNMFTQEFIKSITKVDDGSKRFDD